MTDYELTKTQREALQRLIKIAQGDTASARRAAWLISCWPGGTRASAAAST